jgi:hypothetical protein
MYVCIHACTSIPYIYMYALCLYSCLFYTVYIHVCLMSVFMPVLLHCIYTCTSYVCIHAYTSTPYIYMYVLCLYSCLYFYTVYIHVCLMSVFMPVLLHRIYTCMSYVCIHAWTSTPYIYMYVFSCILQHVVPALLMCVRVCVL